VHPSVTPLLQETRSVLTVPPVSASQIVRSRNDFLLVAIIGLIAILPVWIPTFPAMCDAPQHAAQTAIFSQLGQPGFAYTQLFVRHTNVPNAEGYALLYFLGPLIGLVAATKLIVSAAMLGFLLACAWLLKEFECDPRLALLAVTGLYGFPFQWGFLGFLAAAPVGICFVVLALRYFRAPSLPRGIALALCWLFVFFCHALIAAFAAFVAAACALDGVQSFRQLFRRWLPIAATMAVAGFWWVHSISNIRVSHKPTEWNLDWERFTQLCMNISGVPSNLIAVILIMAFVVPVVALLGVRRQWRFYIPFAVCIVVTFLFPHSIFAVDSVYQRFAPFMLPCFALILAHSTPRRTNLAVIWIVAVALAWTGGMAWRMSVFQREGSGWSTILRQMSPGQRVLSINFEHDSEVFSGAVFLHFPAWYSALKSGIVDPSFASGNVDIALYRPELMPKARFADLEFHPERFNWQSYDGWQYRYFVVHSPIERDAKLFTGSEFPVVLRAHDGDWWLYENTAESLSPPVHP
jgi:hypothetical protein